MVNANDTVSVIVPIYNTTRYLRRCLKCIENQTYEFVQTILVDDGSIDASATVVDESILANDNILVIHKVNGGVSNARNFGMDLAAGCYITFIDSDDKAHPKLIEKLRSIMGNAGKSIASCEYTSNALRALRDGGQNNEVLPLDSLDAIADMLCDSHVTYSVCCKLFPTIITKTVRFDVDYSHNEDLLFCYEAFLKCEKVVHTTEALYQYCTNESSATHMAFSEKNMTAIDVQDAILRDIEWRFPESSLASVAQQQYLKVNVYTYMHMLQSDYRCKSDSVRIKRNIRSRLNHLLRGNLALGYKLYGLAISVLPESALLFLVNRRQ